MRASVWIVFNTLYLCRNAIFIATKVDNAIVLLVATTTMTRRDSPVVVPPCSLGLRLDQRIKRATLK